MCFYSLQQEAYCSDSMRSGHYRGRGEIMSKPALKPVGFWDPQAALVITVASGM